LHVEETYKKNTIHSKGEGGGMILFTKISYKISSKKKKEKLNE